MNSKQTSWSIVMVAALSGTVGLVAFVALMVLGGYGFSAALFLALVIAAVVFVVLMIGFHEKPGRASGTGPGGLSAGAGGGTSAAAPGGASPAASAAPAPAATASAKPAPATPAATASAKPAAPAAAPASPPPAAAKPAAAPAPAKAASDEAGTKPATLAKPREGGADDLKKIKGVGPKLELLCNKLGFYHFDQIANWTDEEVAWVDANLEGFKGRVSRDDWVAQAKLLADGGETAFSKKVDKGGVY